MPLALLALTISAFAIGTIEFAIVGPIVAHPGLGHTPWIADPVAPAH